MEPSERETKKLAEAWANVASHYEFLATASPEAQAWAALLWVMATVYGGPFAAIAFEKKPAQPAPGQPGMTP